jgi:hypothetical protein
VFVDVGERESRDEEIERKNEESETVITTQL